MKAGAFEFLTKPFPDEILLDTIQHAMEQSRAEIGRLECLRVLQQRYRSLSVREQEVMALVVLGRLNKQVGAELGISEITVKAHRGKVMRKMQARSLPELVRMSAHLQLRASVNSAMVDARNTLDFRYPGRIAISPSLHRSAAMIA
jgi:FixJ family two-component response regulator